MAKQQERPLSPHLQIYRPQITSVLSITHRMTGVALFFGMVMIVAGLCAVACGGASFDKFVVFTTSFFGKLVIAGFLWSFYYHLANGIRHFFWDSGQGFELKQIYAGGWIAVGASIVFTILTLLCAAYVMKVKVF